MGSMVDVVLILRRTKNGAYRLIKLDGTVLNPPLLFSLPFTTLIHVHQLEIKASIPVTHLVDCDDLARIYTDEDIIRVNFDYV